jgi:dipeptidyl aminopeptidase/acylaminoacyl peptidase
MRKSFLLCVGLLLFVAAAVAGQITDSTYHRAEAFLPWNLQDLASNASVSPHWIGDGARFWYRRETPRGHEFVVVDPEEDTRHPVFDHERLARALSDATEESYSAERLPFESFVWDPEAGVLRFDLDGRGWECSLPRDGCTELPRPLDISGESRSPDGRWSAFVHEHDLFARSEGAGDTIRLTDDGEPHHAYATPPEGNLRTITLRRRGVQPDPDVAWGPDSRRLLTSRLDEQTVREMHLLEPVPPEDRYRPRVFSYRYPLPGDSSLPKASLRVVDVEEETITPIRSEALSLTEPFSPIGSQVWWSKNGNYVYFLDFSRGRKTVALRAADVETGRARILVKEGSDARIDLNAIPVGEPNVRVLVGGDEVVWFSERDDWGQLYLYDGTTGEQKNRITDGDFVVRDIEFIDADERLIYFTATGVDDDRDPYFRSLYRAPLDGGDLTLLTPEDADHSIEFSPDGRYFVDNYFWGEQRTRPVSVVRNADGEVIRALEQGSLEGLKATGADLPERISVKAADGQTDLYGFLYRPSDFDRDRKYPVLEWVYPYPQTVWSSPGIGTARSQLEHLLEAQAMAELGFVVVTLDGRGTPGRSRTFRHFSYGQLLKGRLQDHVAALRQLDERYPFLDLDRVGVYGHSGGGAGTVRAMLEHPDIYKVGVASSGGQDPRGYHAVGELFQGFPLDGATWDAQANWRLAEQLEGKLLLVHGALDENVHPAHTMRLVNALIEANRDFDLLLMPSQGHGLDENPYFLRRRWDYFVRHLLPANPPADYSFERPPQE